MKRKKTKSYWVEDTPEKLDYINQTLYEENMNLNKELAKYKRAFEVLKKADMFMLEESYGLYKALSGDKTEYLEKEEYELLEELMKDEKC